MKVGGGAESMYRKRPYRIGTGLKFFMASAMKKIRPITLIVWALGRVKKNTEKKVKKMKKYFFVLNKSQSVTHVSTCIFQKLFKTIVLDL